MAFVEKEMNEKEVGNSMAENNSIKTETPKRNNKWIKWVVVVGIVSLFIVYKCCIVRTVDSGNGWKHQRVCFGTCEFLDCTNDATHRIHKSFFNDYYCDNCWELYGKENFERLAEKDTSNKTSENEKNAKICAVKAVEDKLKSPSTAKFCSYPDMTAENLGGNKWRISGYVDAQNSFGATLRENWTVTLTLTESGFTDYTVQIGD